VRENYHHPGGENAPLFTNLPLALSIVTIGQPVICIPSLGDGAMVYVPGGSSPSGSANNFVPHKTQRDVEPYRCALEKPDGQPGWGIAPSPIPTHRRATITRIVLF